MWVREKQPSWRQFSLKQFSLLGIRGKGYISLGKQVGVLGWVYTIGWGQGSGNFSFAWRIPGACWTCLCKKRGRLMCNLATKLCDYLKGGRGGGLKVTCTRKCRCRAGRKQCAPASLRMKYSGFEHVSTTVLLWIRFLGCRAFRPYNRQYLTLLEALWCCGNAWLFLKPQGCQKESLDFIVTLCLSCSPITKDASQSVFCHVEHWLILN